MVIIQLDSEQLFSLIKKATKSAFDENQNASPMPAPAASNEPAFVSAKEAAHMVGLHPNSIWNAARDGRLVRRYIGKSVRFARADVLALAKSHSENNQNNYRNG